MPCPCAEGHATWNRRPGDHDMHRCVCMYSEGCRVGEGDGDLFGIRSVVRAFAAEGMASWDVADAGSGVTEDWGKQLKSWKTQAALPTVLVSLLVTIAGCSSSSSSSSTAPDCDYVAYDGALYADVVATGSDCGKSELSPGAANTYPDWAPLVPRAQWASALPPFDSSDPVACVVRSGASALTVYEAPGPPVDPTGFSREVCQALRGVSNPDG